MPFCESCRTAYRRDADPACETCVRHRRYGLLIEAAFAFMRSWTTHGRGLNLLDAVADLMTDRVRLLRQHRQELRDEIREGQRAAREAFTEGRLEQAHESERW